MADNETLPESQNDASPPDRRAYVPGWIAFALGGALLFVAGIGFVAVYGVPGVGPSNQQQVAGAPPSATAPASGAPAPGNAGQPETTGSGTPAAPIQ